MPEMDGIAAAKALKSVLPTVPVIMFTNFAEDQFLKRAVLAAGIREVVAKSDSPGLVRAVQSVGMQGIHCRSFIELALAAQPNHLQSSQPIIVLAKL